MTVSREQFSQLGFSDQEYQDELGLKALAGEAGYTTLERRWARPTFDINGLWSGYQGEGAKTVLPAKAGAKFSCRLVPNQNPEVIQEGMRKMLEGLCPDSIEMEFIGPARSARFRAFARQPIHGGRGGCD